MLESGPCNKIKETPQSDGRGKSMSSVGIKQIRSSRPVRTASMYICGDFSLVSFFINVKSLFIKNIYMVILNESFK